MPKPKLNQDSRNKEMQGEGNYTAAKEYDDATRAFVKSGKVGQAAKDAAPKNAKEEREMREAEEKGKAHAKPGAQRTRIKEPNTGTDNVTRKAPGKPAKAEKAPGRPTR